MSQDLNGHLLKTQHLAVTQRPHSLVHAQSGLSTITSAIFFFLKIVGGGTQKRARLPPVAVKCPRAATGESARDWQKSGWMDGGMEGWCEPLHLVCSGLVVLLIGRYIDGNYLTDRLRRSRGVGASRRKELRGWGH